MPTYRVRAAFPDNYSGISTLTLGARSGKGDLKVSVAYGGSTTVSVNGPGDYPLKVSATSGLRQVTITGPVTLLGIKFTPIAGPAVAPDPEPEPDPSTVPEGFFEVKSTLAPKMTGVHTSKDHLVARRFTLVADPSIYQDVASKGYKVWLGEQLSMTEDDDRAWLDKLTAELPLSTLTYEDAQNRYREIVGNSWGGVDSNAASEQRRGATILHALFSQRLVGEALSQMWLDHFAMPFMGEQFPSFNIDKRIRPVAATTFEQVLRTMYGNLAVYQFLDNTENRAGAINENLGRETLELYTVGLDHHTEEDVRQLSIMFSGWSHSWDGKGNLTLQPTWHQFTPEPLKICGKTYPNATHREALDSHAALLGDLARHPGTARTVAHRLATRFVREDPPQALVDRLSTLYLSNGGDIKALIWAIVDSPEFTASAGCRWKRPAEVIHALHKARQVTWDPTDGNMWNRTLHQPLPKYQQHLDTAGNRPRSWLAPDGLSDSDSYWQGSSAILQSINAITAAGPLDPELTQTRSLAQIIGAVERSDRTQTAQQIALAMTGYWPNRQITESMVTDLSGMGTWDERVEAAVRTVMVSPLGFLR